MLKTDVAQPYIEDGSIKETAKLLLDAQAGALGRHSHGHSGDSCQMFRIAVWLGRRAVRCHWLRPEGGDAILDLTGVVASFLLKFHRYPYRVPVGHSET